MSLESDIYPITTPLPVKPPTTRGLLLGTEEICVSTKLRQDTLTLTHEGLRFRHRGRRDGVKSFSLPLVTTLHPSIDLPRNPLRLRVTGLDLGTWTSSPRDPSSSVGRDFHGTGWVSDFRSHTTTPPPDDLLRPTPSRRRDV